VAGMLLVVDNDHRWLDNVAQTVPSDVASVFKADTADAARKLVRQYRFDVVIVDMAMDPEDDRDRSNAPLETYLSGHPEGTLYIVLSQHLVREGIEVSEHYLMGALSVEHKAHLDPAALLDKIQAAVATASAGMVAETKRSRDLIIPDIFAEQQLLTALTPVGGMAGVFRVVDAVLLAVAPLRSHLYRKTVYFAHGCAMFLGWSRLRGCAVVILLAASSLDPEEAAVQLRQWLGYEPKVDPFLKRDVNRVKVTCWDDQDLGDELFDLPTI
jgi:hypothetical protein